MFHVWLRNYPQEDIDITEEWDLIPFSNLKRANAFIQDLEKLYSDSGWIGHPLYRAKFYAEEVKKTMKYFMITFQKDMRRNVIIRARNKRTAKQLAFERYYIDKKNIIQIKEITKEITKR